MKFTVKKARKFGWEGVLGWNVNLEDTASVSYIEIDTEIPLRKNSKNNRVYFLIDGEVVFLIDNKKYRITDKQAIFIPKNTKYSYKPKGKIKLVEANIPAFDEASEIIIKE